jgi:hypothetical protein
MKDANGNLIQGRTRWRRVLILFGPATALAVTMIALVANGVLAVSFAVSGMPFKLTADKLDGSNFVQIGSLNGVNACDAANSGSTPPSCVSAGGNSYQFTAATLLTSATIYNLNQTVCGDLPILTQALGLHGLVTLKAGDAGNVAANQPQASNLVVDATSLNGGTANFDQGINIGQDFAIPDSLLFGGAANPAHGAHTFSQQAPHVVITTLSQKGTDTSAGTFTLPNLQLSAALVSTCP